jgi:hypothetical protein
MSDGDRIKTEGEPIKRFRVYRADIYKCEGEYNTIEEVKAHRWRLDRNYKIEIGRKFMTRSEFDEWAKNQK